MLNILKENEKPDWVKYPSAYLELIEQEQDKFLPWYLMDKEPMLIRNEGLKERYPNRTLFAFARDGGSDDIACWEQDKPGMVILIHDFASSGYEDKMEFETFEAWYSFVLENY